ncbi:hypothetical protein [Streptomyces sp. MnatMP-M17]|uniref:hypothetical protein n=1 Tax=unclassified Streptomyces TaxID=2593676 RepID=UPI00081DE583|nr:hypothetical protein [Streptomyces sp. MnatMP-M17]MYZ33627.1 hypothetical protein [Streptomyces sp. SID4917]SCF60525.1 hypothetical protein GA0115259_100092 [Streptomyces sp. MnatMP-M17]
MTSISELLAHAAIPTSHRGFDVAGALRRIASEAARLSPPPHIERATQAGQRLSVVCRWVINEPNAAVHMDRLADDARLTPPTTNPDGELDIEGALVFACLLHLTNHPESAQFWWQLAAGAGSRAAAYCLHLHHLKLGETEASQHWYHQLTHSMADSAPPDAAFIEGLEAVARYVRTSGTGASAPTGGLESEVDRLASRGTNPSGVIEHRPDRRLAQRLHEFTARR